MRPLLLLVALFTLLGSTGASHCGSGWTDEPELTLCDLGPAPLCVYGVIEWCQPDCVDPYNIVLYEESNGLDGLQRDDPYEDGTCHGLVPADRIVLRPL